MDTFWGAYETDELVVQQGQEEGRRHADELNELEGWEQGINDGYDVGFRVGFYIGFLKAFQVIRDKEPTHFSERVLILIKRWEGIMEQFSMENTEADYLHRELNRMDEVYKQINAILKVKSRSRANSGAVEF